MAPRTASWSQLLLLLAWLFAARGERSLRQIPCPCANRTAQVEEVKHAVQQAWFASYKNIEDAAASSAAAWVASLSNATRMAPDAVEQVRAEQGLLTETAVKAESDHEAGILFNIWRALQAVEKQDEEEVNKTAYDWGRSQAQKEIMQVTSSAMHGTLEAEARAEEMRRETAANTQVAILTAFEMVQAAKEAEQVAANMTQVNAEELAVKVEAEDRKALAQAQHSEKVAEMAGQVVREADKLAGRALKRAVAAEATAEQALSNAKRNAARIVTLKLRTQRALQQAETAAEMAR